MYVRGSMMTGVSKNLISLSGSIDDWFDFNQIEIPGGTGIMYVDLSQVKLINSQGVKNWKTWIQKVSKSYSIVFQNVPSCIIFQMNTIAGFMPPNSMVESFEIPFFCGVCEKDVKKFVKVGEDIIVEATSARPAFRPHTFCPDKRGDCELEMDIIEQKYFKFLFMNIPKE